MNYLLIGFGGAVGASLRYFTSILFMSLNQASVFPFATLTVNLLGSFIFGLLSSGLESHLKIDEKYLPALKTGLIGGFTTFSTLSVETFALLENQYFLFAFIYIFVSAMFGLLFASLGIKIGRRFVKKEEVR